MFNNNRLKELRTEKECTQKTVADAVGVSQRNYIRWENGSSEPAIHFVVALADFFGVSTDYLLGREDDFGNILLNSENMSYSDEEREVIRQFRNLSPQFKKIIKDNLKTLNEKD